MIISFKREITAMCLVCRRMTPKTSMFICFVVFKEDKNQEEWRIPSSTAQFSTWVQMMKF